MIHPCAACALRFRTTGELTQHIADEHLVAPPPENTRGVQRTTLSDGSFTRSGWAVPVQVPVQEDVPEEPSSRTPSA